MSGNGHTSGLVERIADTDDVVLAMAARIGNYLVDVTDVTNYASFVEELVTKLEADTRVANVARPDFIPPPGSVNGWPSRTLFPLATSDAEVKADRPGDEDKITVVELPVVQYVVDVPAKNQPRTKGGEVPSERYFAAWDGTTLVAAWLRDPYSHVTTPSGGHIVGTILRDAVNACGARVLVQACTPSCEYEFNHGTLLVDVVVDAAELSIGPTCMGDNLHIVVPPFRQAENTPEAHTSALLWVVRKASLELACVKNLAFYVRSLSFRAADAAENALGYSTPTI